MRATETTDRLRRISGCERAVPDASGTPAPARSVCGDVSWGWGAAEAQGSGGAPSSGLGDHGGGGSVMPTVNGMSLRKEFYDAKARVAADMIKRHYTQSKNNTG